jgi:hypothetical protein
MGDARGFRVALLSAELVNPAAGGLDALAVLERLDWGAIQLPAVDYPEAVAAPLLEQAAEQAEEFARHGYALALVGRRDGVEEALARYGLVVPPAIGPATPEELERFLMSVAS